VARKPYLGIAMEGPIATWYARSTRGRLPAFVKTAAEIASWLPAGGAVLEVAPGPGYLAIEIAKLRRYQVTGLDISKSFVRIASQNAASAGVTVDFRHGDVARMPFPDASFDFVICQAAFKNFAEPLAALDEIHRVLRAGGSASIQDLRKNAPSHEIDAEIESMALDPLSALFTQLTFRFGLLRAAYKVEAIERLASRSRFGKAQILTNGIGFDLRLTKPEAMRRQP